MFETADCRLTIKSRKTADTIHLRKLTKRILCKNTTVKPAYVVTSIKGSLVLSSHFSGSTEPKYSANEPVLAA